MNSSFNNYAPLKLNTPFGEIHAISNHSNAETRVLFLHGWLDNCASFTPVLPYLSHFNCVAIDMIGHGKSTHRTGESLNHFVDYARDIQQILEALEWENCHLVGHSMGGAIGLLCASAIPGYILSLTMIDALHPLSRAPEDAPKLLRKSISQFSNWNQERQRIFTSLESAIKSRMRASPYPQSYDNAKLLMQRATEEAPEGYRLRSDARLNFNSSLMLDRAQIEAFIKAVEQPILAILASDGLLKKHLNSEQALHLFKNISVKTLQGGHHIHMEKPAETSQFIQSFIDEQQ